MTVKIWDLPTRLYHWAQAILFAGLAVTGLTEQGPHIYLGLALFALLVWRIMWGIFGSETSKFASFLHSPITVIQYIQGNFIEKPGHNPTGGYMVLVLILTMLLQCLTGLALSGMLDPLPSSEVWLNDNIFDICVFIHENLINGLFILVGFHITAITIYKLRAKPLVWAMITGYQKGFNTPVKLASNYRAIAFFLIAVSLTTFIYLLSAE